MRRSNFITVMLVIIVIVLVAALAISVYYVFFSSGSGFLSLKNKDVNLGNTGVVSTGRKYTRKVSGKEFNAEIYSDGNMGISIYTEGEVASKMLNTKKLTGNIDKVEIKDVEDVYEVKAGKYAETALVVLKVDGTVSYLDLDELYKTGTVKFVKIEDLKSIVRIFQTGVITDVKGYSFANNVIAVDEVGKEYIITDKIISKADIVNITE